MNLRRGVSRVVTESMIRQLARKKAPLLLRDDSIITPAAKDLIRELNIPVIKETQTLGGVAPVMKDAPADKLRSLKVVAIGADHGGFKMKESLKKNIRDMGFEIEDYGTFSEEPVDYPDIAEKVAISVVRGNSWRGIVIDGAGIGSAIAANKVPGIRAANCVDVTTAANAREHNDTNVLTLGAGIIGNQVAGQIVETWLKTAFAGGRHQRRVDKLIALDQARNKPFGT